MLEKFIEAVKNNNIEQIKNIIHSNQFNAEWLKNSAIESEIHQLSESLQYYAFMNNLGKIYKVLISLKNDKVIEYIKNNEHLNINDINSLLLRNIMLYEDKDAWFNLFESRNFNWQTIFHDYFEGKSLTALEYFHKYNTSSLDKTLSLIKSSPNADLHMQARFKGKNFIDAIFKSKNCKNLIDKYFDLIKDHLNKAESGSDNMTPLLLGFAKNPKILDHIHYLVGMEDEDGLPIFNINIASKSGKRIIDMVADDEIYSMTLREYGSVEPKTPIASGNIIQKIVISSEKSADLIAGNKEKTVKIIDLLYKKYPLTDAQIDQEINWLKNSKDYSDHFAEWRDQGVNTVLKVIDKLTSMTVVNDRLDVSWNFKKILATIIHIVKNDQNLLLNLETTLSQLQLCALSKLMNLLSVVQDKLITDSQNDYSKMTIDDFGDVLGGVFDEIQSLGDKGALFFAKWLNDRLNEGNNKNPDKWSPATQKIQGIFNKIFFENFRNVDHSSYHFNDGLELKLISELIEYLMPGSTKATTISDENIINKFIKLNEQGSALLIDEYINQFIDNEGLLSQHLLNLVDDIANFRIKILNNTDFYNVSKETIVAWYKKLNSKTNFDTLKEFFSKIREEFEINPEARSLISGIIDPYTKKTIEKIFFSVCKNVGPDNAQKFLENNIKNSSKGLSPDAEKWLSEVLAFNFSSDQITTDELTALGMDHLAEINLI